MKAAGNSKKYATATSGDQSVTTNADRRTPETTDALIAEARVKQLAVFHHGYFPDVADDLIPRLADALEASEAQVARLRANIKACDGICECHLDERYPPELLASVREYDILHKDVCVDECKARATLRRYGLLLKEAR